jgi:hypothetical protein
MPSHAGYPVRVAIKSHGYAGVPQEVLDQFRVDATPQKQVGACVPEIVPTNRGETRALEERLEVAVDDVLSVEGSTLTSSENEVRVFV